MHSRRMFIVGLLMVISGIITGCNRSSVATVTKLSSPLFALPSRTNIVSLSITNDTNANKWTTSRPKQVMAHLDKWLLAAKPVAVKYPNPNYSYGATVQNVVGPSILNILVKGGAVYHIMPANYVWAMYPPNAPETFEYRYVPNIVEVIVNSQQEEFLESSALYDWLKTGGWKSDFRGISTQSGTRRGA